MQDFRKLDVWRKAHDLALATYKATGGLPRQELYGLTSQMRRAAVSIPTNLAEGCVRSSDADFARFVAIALGSANEVEYLLLLVRDLGFLDKDLCQQLTGKAIEVKMMLAALLKKLKTDR